MRARHVSDPRVARAVGDKRFFFKTIITLIEKMLASKHQYVERCVIVVERCVVIERCMVIERCVMV